jgi:hypothetical protein
MRQAAEAGPAVTQPLIRGLNSGTHAAVSVLHARYVCGVPKTTPDQ